MLHYALLSLISVSIISVLFIIPEILTSILGVTYLTITCNKITACKKTILDFPVLIKQTFLISYIVLIYIATTVLRIPLNYSIGSVLLFLLIPILYKIQKEKQHQTIITNIRFLIKNHWKKFLFFYGVYVFLSIIRINFADYNITERPMDFTFIYNLTKQNFLPPENPWLSGLVLNYYYLGHFTVATILRITHIPPEFGYNLFISIIAVWTLQSFWQLTHFIFKQLKITNKTIFTYIISLTLTFGGNFYSLFKVLLPSLIDPTTKHSFYYPDATRVIPNTINEFVSYSITVGDLHGHFISLSFFILNILLLYLLITQQYKKLFPTKLFSTITGLMLFWDFGTNSWDTIPLFFWIILLGVVYLLPKILETIFSYWRKYSFTSFLKYILTDFYQKNKNLVWDLLTTGTISLSLIWIFKQTFLPPVEGIGFKIHFDYKWAHLLWGQFILLTTIILIYLFFASSIKFKDIKFPILLIVLAIFDIVLVNFFFVKSIFYLLKTPNYRTNSVFKLYYTSWALWGVGAFTLTFYILEKMKNTNYRLIILTLLSLTIGIMWYYPGILLQQAFGLKTTKDWTQLIKNIPYLTEKLDGTKFLDNKSFIDGQIKNYIKTQFKTPIHIAEFTDWDSYNMEHARFCTLTGNICILGWPLHNYQWYKQLQSQAFSYPELKLTNIDISERLLDIHNFYKSPEYDFILKYKPDIIILGSKEKALIQEQSESPQTFIQTISQWCTPVILTNPRDKTDKGYIFICNSNLQSKDL